MTDKPKVIFNGVVVGYVNNLVYLSDLKSTATLVITKEEAKEILAPTKLQCSMGVMETENEKDT